MRALAYTAIGHGVSVARALETTCVPGRIQVSQAVTAQLPAGFVFGAPRERDLGGGLGILRVSELDPLAAEVRVR